MTLRPGTAHEVSAAGPPHWRGVSAALASAFYDDPVWSWLLPDDATRISSLRRFFGIEARHIVLQHGRSLAGKDGDEILGAALVLPPGRWRTPLRVQALHAPGYARVFGRRLPRALGVLAQMERRHPSRPHSYLAYVGVAASAQERGLGTALLTPMLDRCDRERLPAYLEASSPASARLYARLGFTTIEEIRPLGAPPIQLMSREPAA